MKAYFLLHSAAPSPACPMPVKLDDPFAGLVQVTLVRNRISIPSRRHALGALDSLTVVKAYF